MFRFYDCVVFAIQTQVKLTTSDRRVEVRASYIKWIYTQKPKPDCPLNIVELKVIVFATHLCLTQNTYCLKLHEVPSETARDTWHNLRFSHAAQPRTSPP